MKVQHGNTTAHPVLRVPEPSPVRQRHRSFPKTPHTHHPHQDGLIIAHCDRATQKAPASPNGARCGAHGPETHCLRAARQPHGDVPQPAIRDGSWVLGSRCVAVWLLLLHPLPLDGSIFCDGLRALADVAVAPTLYGAGDDLTSWAAAALEAVGDGPVVVVGNSIGGSCAIEVARRAPEKVKALVLCGAQPAHRPEPKLRDAALRVLASDGLAAAWERYWLPLFGPNASAAVIEDAWRVASAVGPERIAAGVRAFHGRRSVPALVGGAGLDGERRVRHRPRSRAPTGGAAAERVVSRGRRCGSLPPIGSTRRAETDHRPGHRCRAASLTSRCNREPAFRGSPFSPAR